MFDSCHLVRRSIQYHLWKLSVKYEIYKQGVANLFLFVKRYKRSSSWKQFTSSKTSSSLTCSNSWENCASQNWFHHMCFICENIPDKYIEITIYKFITNYQIVGVHGVRTLKFMFRFDGNFFKRTKLFGVLSSGNLTYDPSIWLKVTSLSSTASIRERVQKKSKISFH